jgi:hypothetical protein
MILKVGLSTGSAPTDVGRLTLDPGENEATCIVVDPAGEFAYVGLSTGRVVKVAINGESGAMSREGSMSTGLSSVASMALSNGRIFAGGNEASNGTVVRIDLSTFTVSGSAAPPVENRSLESNHVSGFMRAGGQEAVFLAFNNQAALSFFETQDGSGIVEITGTGVVLDMVSGVGTLEVGTGISGTTSTLFMEAGLGVLDVINNNPEPASEPIHVRSIALYERQVIAAGESPQVRLTGEQVALWEEFTIRWDAPVRLAVIALEDEGSWQDEGVGGGPWEGVVVEVYSTADSIPTILEANRASKGLLEIPLSLGPDQTWRFRIIRKTGERVNSFSVWTLQQRPVQGDAIRALGAGGGRVPEWMYTSYQFDSERAVASFRCLLKDESSPVRFALHADDSPAAFAEVLSPQGLDGGVFQQGDTERVVNESPWMKCLRLRMLPTSPAVDADGEALEFARLANVADMQVYLRETVPIQEYSAGVIVRDALRMGAWKNKVLMFEDSGRFAVVRVVASSYGDNGIRVRLLPVQTGGSGFTNEWAHQVVVTGYRDILLPDGPFTARNWALFVERERDPDEVHLIPWKEIFLRDGRFVIRRPSTVFSWRAFKLMAERPFSPSYARVVSSIYPVGLKLSRVVPTPPPGGQGGEDYSDPSAAIDVVAMSEEPFRLPRVNPWRAWRMEVDPEVGSQEPVSDNRIAEIRVGNSSRGV